MKVWMRGLGGVLHRLAGAIDVELAGTRQPAHHRALEALGDLGDGVEIALGGDREAGLDDVHAHGVEEVGDLLLLLEGHGGAGALLAVAQRGVEDEDLVGVGGLVRLLRSAVAGAGLLVSVMVGGPRLRPGDLIAAGMNECVQVASGPLSDRPGHVPSAGWLRG